MADGKNMTNSSGLSASMATGKCGLGHVLLLKTQSRQLFYIFEGLCSSLLASFSSKPAARITETFLTFQHASHPVVKRKIFFFLHHFIRFLYFFAMGKR